MTINVSIRAAEAARLLDNLVLVDVFAEIEADSLAACMASPADAVSDRERLWMLMKSVQVIRDKLQAVIDDEKIITARSTEAMS